MTRALLVVDVQNDFTEGGALGCDGGAELAGRISGFLAEHRRDYAVVVASRDWHDAGNDNGGHFSDHPDLVDSWPAHCVAGTSGANYHPALTLDSIDEHVFKGQGSPAYSAFEGITDEGRGLAQILESRKVTELDIVGIATDHCVRASALDASAAGMRVTVKANLCVGVDPAASVTALGEMAASGITISVTD